MKQGSSSRKVNEQAREVIASILLFDISDPELSMVTITGCEVSFDRSVCNVYYSTDKQRYDKVAEAIEQVNESGYGIVAPTIDDLTLEEPEIVKQAGGYGVRLKASGPVPWRASRSVRRSS